jgi:hypothetical protein
VRDLLGLQATRLDGFGLEIEQSGRLPIVMNLQNVHAETRLLEGDARAQHLRTAVLALVPSLRPATWDEAAPRLLPAVRAAGWLTASDGQRAAAGRPARPFARPFVPFVSALCAIDSKHAMTFATDADLAAWGVNDDQAMRAATDNLARIPISVARSGRHAVVRGPDGYISSWLAVPSALAKVAVGADGAVLACAPSRDRLVLLDADDESTAGMLERVLQEYQSAPRQLSPVPYLIRDGEIEPWQPSAGHAARPIVDRVSRILAASAYGQQQSRLQVIFDNANEDVSVARYSLMQRQDRSMWSWAAWVRQVTNGLVPQVDVVILVDNDDPRAGFAVGWSDALQLASEALHEEAALDPPRWRYRGWPDNETLAALKERAVPLPPAA